MTLKCHLDSHLRKDRIQGIPCPLVPPSVCNHGNHAAVPYIDILDDVMHHHSYLKDVHFTLLLNIIKLLLYKLPQVCSLKLLKSSLKSCSCTRECCIVIMSERKASNESFQLKKRCLNHKCVLKVNSQFFFFSHI